MNTLNIYNISPEIYHQGKSDNNKNIVQCFPRCIFVFMDVCALSVVLAESQLSAYVGDSVTLPSKISPSLNITSIKWWVFFNETWIATYRGEKTNTDLFYLYRGRLDLNATSGTFVCPDHTETKNKPRLSPRSDSTGDLTIRNVRTEDGTKYTVEIITADRKRQEAKVKLVVRRKCVKLALAWFVSPW